MAKASVQRDERSRRLMMHAALREAQDRYAHELLGIEERGLLAERIIRIKKRLAKSA
jgi:hypothetical protein